MSQLQHYLAIVAGGVSALAFALLVNWGFSNQPAMAAVLALGVVSLGRFWLGWSLWLDGAIALFGAILLMVALPGIVPAPTWFWAALIAFWLFGWLFVERLSKAIGDKKIDQRVGVIIPLVFGAALLVIWEAITVGLAVPTVIMPPPSMIWAKLISSVPTLLADFNQTVLKAVLIGYIIGCGSGFLVAILIDRSPFFKRGLLPLGNFVSALPIIGVAPIMV
ncbi:MAG: ABC transporter permease, partial [Devosia nanyangense]|nr:ABC transporter permease [Devosia nanyangense]